MTLYRSYLKYTFDFVVSMVVLVVLFVPMLCVAVLVLISDRGNCFFLQRRIGKGGKMFSIVKFRTMHAHTDRADAGVDHYWTKEHDSRITAIGKWLRRSSVDELPQLWNVVRGDMSLVGPRPDVEEQRSLYSPDEFALRHSIKPGITGLAQARNRHGCTQRRRLRYDLFYAQKYSLGFDLKILVWTIDTVMRGSF